MWVGLSEKNILLKYIMSNYFGQLPPQFNNRYINNNLVNGYQQFTNTNVPFNANSMLMNNPTFFGSIRDANFYNRVNMAKMEQLRKVNSVKDLNLSEGKLAEYVICPIKIEKMDKSELDNLYSDRTSIYIKKNQSGADIIPQMLMEWYQNRKNTPYKNILKNENYTREFNNINDLIVHRVTQLDKDKIRLEQEYEVLSRLLEKHDGELKIIYSSSEETKYKEQFNYINYYKNRIKYDPKNYNDLKKFYKKEQKKINKENERIDQMVEMLIVSDEITKEELAEITKPYEDEDDDTNIDVVFEKGEKELERHLEKKLRKELGEEQYNEIMKQVDEHISDDEKNNEPQERKVRKIKISKNKNGQVHIDPEEPEKVPIKIRKVKIISSKINKDVSESNIIGQVDDDEMEKYKNRKKKDSS